MNVAATPASERGQAHTDRSRQIDLPALGNRRCEGKIAYVGSAIDATTRAARARLELDNADGAQAR